MNRLSLIPLAFLASTISVCAIAQSTDVQSIDEKSMISGKSKILPDRGYIFLHGPDRQAGLFLRLPDAETVREYEAKRAEALEKEIKRYASAYKAWQSDAKTAKERKEKLPEEPVKPTPDSFSITPIELMYPVFFGPQNTFSKTGSNKAKEFSYLTAVKPGTYVYYGPVLRGDNGITGSCYCMGTVQFEVKPGVITDIGNFLLVGPGADKDFANRKLAASEHGLYQPQNLGTVYGPLRYGLPTSLKSYPSVQADFRAHGWLGNFYGIAISRMPPVEGVLGYDRKGGVIDLKAAKNNYSTPAN